MREEISTGPGMGSASMSASALLDITMDYFTGILGKVFNM